MTTTGATTTGATTTADLLTVRAVQPEDRPRWREMYAAYAHFYRLDLSAEQLEHVWSWLLDDAHEVEGLVAETATGRLVGLAHYRPFSRPRFAGVGGFLDDLFVDPDARGAGAADALLLALQDIAAQRGWNVVRWVTADDNYRARAKYDQYAARTPLITYDMPPGQP